MHVTVWMSIMEFEWPKSWGVECGVASVLPKTAGAAPRHTLLLTASYHELAASSSRDWEKNVEFFLEWFAPPVQDISRFFKNVLVSSSSYMLTDVNSILKSFNVKYYEIFYCEKIHYCKVRFVKGRTKLAVQNYKGTFEHSRQANRCSLDLWGSVWTSWWNMYIIVYLGVSYRNLVYWRSILICFNCLVISLKCF